MKKKLNKFDFIVIAAVLLILIGAALKFTVLNQTGTKETVDLSYTVRVSNVRQYTVDALAEGDALFTGNDCAAMGTVAAVDAEPAKSVITRLDGTSVWGEREDKYDIYITVNVTAELVDGVYRVGTNELRVNQSSSLFTKYSSFTGTITEITPAE